MTRTIPQMAQDIDGAVQVLTRKNQLTGGEVSLFYVPWVDRSARWELVCEHGMTLGVSTRQMATHHIADPTGWCDECYDMVSLHMNTTESQDARQAAKDASGRYKKHRCERCDKPAPMNYYSAGEYVVLCRRCCIAVEDGVE